MAEDSHEKPAHQGDIEAGNEASPVVETSAYYPSAEAPLSKIRFWLVLLSLETGMFAVALDFSIVPTAVPWISSNGNLGYNNSAWIGNLPDPSWSWRSTICRFDYLGTLCLVAGNVCMLLATASGSTILPWVSGQLVTISISLSGLVLLTAFFIVETLVPEPLLHPSLFRNPGLLTTALAAIFHGANMVGTMYYIPHFFQLVFQNYPLISGVGMLPMMLGMGIGGIASTLIKARYRTSLRSARVGAALLVLASGLMVRWNTDTSRAETVAVLALLGLGQGASMIGLLHTAQASVDSPTLATATMNFKFVQASGFTFGVACFGALYFNKLRSLLAGLALGATDVDGILADALYTEDNELDVDVKHRILNAHGLSLRDGWWLMFACAAAVLALSLCIRQRDARKEEDSSILEDGDERYEL